MCRYRHPETEELNIPDKRVKKRSVNALRVVFLSTSLNSKHQEEDRKLNFMIQPFKKDGIADCAAQRHITKSSSEWMYPGAKSTFRAHSPRLGGGGLAFYPDNIDFPAIKRTTWQRRSLGRGAPRELWGKCRSMVRSQDRDGAEAARHRWRRSRLFSRRKEKRVFGWNVTIQVDERMWREQRDSRCENRQVLCSPNEKAFHLEGVFSGKSRGVLCSIIKLVACRP